MNDKRFLGMILLLLVLGLAWVGLTPTAVAQGTGRLVIKNADIEVLVEDTDTAVTAAHNLARTFDAYTLRERVWDGDDRRFRYAVITFGLNAADFEGFLQSLKTLGTVLDETGSGQDITDQVTDLESELNNLLATQERIRTFMDQAGTITETLKVHQELLDLEAEIGEVQGQMNFLQDRANAATLTLHLTPFIPTPTPTFTPTATPTMTPTPTATPTMTPTPEIWDPGATAKKASGRLANTSQGLADFFIYRVIVSGPWLLFWGLLGYVGWRAFRRWENAPRLEDIQSVLDPVRVNPPIQPREPAPPSVDEEE